MDIPVLKMSERDTVGQRIQLRLRASFTGS